ncbi:MAG: hypothetical protein ABIP28_12510, partial [Mucilaginibacter sp.]
NFNSLYKKKDEWTTGDEAIANRVPHYLAFMGCRELGLLALKSVFYESVLKVPVENKRSVFTLLTGKFKLRDMHLGGYVENKEHKIEQALLLLKEKGNDIKFEGYSDYQIEYLNKMIAACQKAGVKMILLNSPIYKDAQMGYNQKDFYAYYKQHLQHLPFWDFHNMPYESKKFRDTDHLNADGAKEFSLYLKEQLDAGK